MSEQPVTFDSGGFIPSGTVRVVLDVAECVFAAADVQAGVYRCCRTDPPHVKAAGHPAPTPTSAPVFDDGRRRIYPTGNVFVISEGGAWLPGCYATVEAAHLAFDCDDSVLVRLRDRLAGERPDDLGVITETMLREAQGEAG